MIPNKTLSYLKAKSDAHIFVSNVDAMLRLEFKEFWNNKLTKNDRIEIIGDNKLIGKSYKFMNNVQSDPEEPQELDADCLNLNVESGRDCGCCGSYEGTCSVCSIVCFVHDVTCVSCQPAWYCLRGCSPGPC